MAAAVHAFGLRPAAFSAEPAVACRAYGWWQVASSGRRLWPADVEVVAEGWSEDGWQSVEVLEVEPLAGRVRLAVTVERLRLSGDFLPLTPVATGEAWRLETSLAVPGATLTGHRGPSRVTGGRALLERCEVTGELKGPFLLDLDTDPGAYHVLGERAIRRGDRLEVTVDPSSCRHVGG